MKTVVDYIIVGQGIAGTCMAFRLIEAGYRVLVIDKFQPFSSTRVAAGIMNPVTGRKLVKSWLAEELLSEAGTFYRGLEALLDIKIYHPIPIYRVFASVIEQNQWFERGEELDHHNFLSDVVYPNWSSLPTPFGMGIIKQGAWVNTTILIDAFRQWLKQQSALLEESFNPLQIQFEPELSYNGITAKGIIFCEGPNAIHNPYFKYLPFNLAKGEVLKVKSDGLTDLDGLVSKNGFVLPLGNGVFNVGATYKWNDYEFDISEDAFIELADKWSKITDAPFELIEQKAGIRPTVKDRKPFIGVHPFHPNLYIFNGMGTKGISLAPFFSKLFLDALEEKVSLPDDVNIARYEKLITCK
jgi:glycine/D-amino acid oxidase-like deaminating enzyme